MKKILILFVLVVISLTFFVPCDDSFYVENVSLNKIETELEVGEKEVLIANLNPENATNKNCEL